MTIRSLRPFRWLIHYYTLIEVRPADGAVVDARQGPERRKRRIVLHWQLRRTKGRRAGVGAVAGANGCASWIGNWYGERYGDDAPVVALAVAPTPAPITPTELTPCGRQLRRLVWQPAPGACSSPFLPSWVRRLRRSKCRPASSIWCAYFETRFLPRKGHYTKENVWTDWC